MYTMADIRTWTVKRRDGDYDIVLTLGNRRWRIGREGSRWRFGNSLYPNLRIVKQLIVDAANLNHSSDDQAEVAEPNRCIDPCALLIVNRVRLSDEVLHTLDLHGWLVDEGEPDWQRAIDQTHRYHRLDAAERASTDSTPVCLTMEA